MQSDMECKATWRARSPAQAGFRNAPSVHRETGEKATEHISHISQSSGKGLPGFATEILSATTGLLHAPAIKSHRDNAMGVASGSKAAAEPTVRTTELALHSERLRTRPVDACNACLHCTVRRHPRSTGANFAQGNSETRQGMSQSSSSKAQATGTTSVGGAGNLCPALPRFGTPWRQQLLWQAVTIMTHRSPSFSASHNPSSE